MQHTKQARQARTLLKVAGVLLVVAVFSGVIYQLAPLHDGADLLCGNRESLPSEVGHPSVDLLHAEYTLFPARLECTWAAEPDEVSRTYIMNAGADLIALGALLAAASIAIAAGMRRRRHGQDIG